MSVVRLWGVGLGSGESARLPPLWLGFGSRTWRHMWVEFVAGCRPCPESFFFRVLRFSSLHQKNTFQNLTRPGDSGEGPPR